MQHQAVASGQYGTTGAMSDSGSHAETQRSSSSIVDVIRESIGEMQTSKGDQRNDSGSKGKGFRSGASVMRVTCSQVPRIDKRPEWIYPYAEMPSNKQAYRGFPLDWTESLLKGGFKIQIVSPTIGEPTEPMAAFPPAVLVKEKRTDGSVRYMPGRITHYSYPLSDEMIANNTAGSGNASRWYYAAGLEAPPYRVAKTGADDRQKSVNSEFRSDLVARLFDRRCMIPL
eukprot:Polyplicarium_translucidae@DN985_c0_g1_i1.p1